MAHLNCDGHPLDCVKSRWIIRCDKELSTEERGREKCGGGIRREREVT